MHVVVSISMVVAVVVDVVVSSLQSCELMELGCLSFRLSVFPWVCGPVGLWAFTATINAVRDFYCCCCC